MVCAHSKDLDHPGHPASLISLRCPHEESLGPQLPTAKSDQTGLMPRLSAQSDLSLQWAHVILLFCRESAKLYFYEKYGKLSPKFHQIKCKIDKKYLQSFIKLSAK